ncbi:MAG: rRNA cytosine-C5-methylase [Rhodospirillaceae bacterium]|nr:rRNA cytosine-C5-methylase [Rhodospirillaceae bacterium]|tara:strand:- start:3539 stop:4831 length:1293 start_codon:yes stop_codon:yes gene_type:complete
MNQAGRTSAAIELLETISNVREPADIVISEYFRRRRYAGSGDRRFIRNLVYNSLRHMGFLKWQLKENGADTTNSRNLMIANIMANNPSELESIFCDNRFSAGALSNEEVELTQRLKSQNKVNDVPQWAKLNCPEWLLEKFISNFPDTYKNELEALNVSAPIDLRVNELKSSRELVQAYLEDDGYLFTPTPLSLLGLRSSIWSPLLNTKSYRDGLFQIQDEGSQMIACAVNARPGEKIADLCAGAGGKSLALAAIMKNEGQIIAADISSSRLNRIKPRIKRAGINIINTAPFDASALAQAIDPLDRVLIDAPCSGTGTWRRHPEARWRLNSEQLENYVKVQADLLRDGAKLVRPGGWVIYATCSLLKDENEDQVGAFLNNHQEFTRLPVKEYLDDHQLMLTGLDGESNLSLSPARSNTDGVFVAVFEKASK